MHGISHFLHKHQSRESTPSIAKDDSFESWCSTLSSVDSHSSVNDENSSKAIPINRRAYCTHRSFRGSPLDTASSPRDRYPNFSSYFRDVTEGYASPSPIHYHAHSFDPKTRRTDEERYQSTTNAYHTPRQDRHFVSPLYNEYMDDIQENEYSKCERYGEISSTKLSHTYFKNRIDNKSFAQKLTESANSCKDQPYLTERRGSGSSASGNRHKHSIQELIRTFSKKVGHWRHESGEGRRGSCAVPATSTDRTIHKDEFRLRSKSLDGDHIQKGLRRSVLEDCGATYQIFETILKEGNLHFMLIGSSVDYTILFI
ncbi:unnamed protein product [Euphydryas editha]|uniref:Uncharacterized protein n=1 Tax=Euphydryas editha TaxID=104508 RepID=A0AAU9UX85_EUPED|nr:unnamed protein product [Euphydryas editha]